ncbi:hypothetical protein [Pseudomonas fluorescens]|jgi:hypothetical protein
MEPMIGMYIVSRANRFWSNPPFQSDEGTALMPLMALNMNCFRLFNAATRVGQMLIYYLLSDTKDVDDQASS